MKQEYHSNAKTNVNIRSLIKNSSATNSVLSKRFDISQPTISKWRNREELEDKNSRPDKINYSLTELEKEIVCFVRKSTWMPLDDVLEIAQNMNDELSRSAVYRTLKNAGISKVPQKEREKAKKFKEYKPGFIHIDVTYLPDLDGNKHYLFVAIDRATRAMFYVIYDSKTAENAKYFAYKCLDFFPFNITHILTDNGLEFTNHLIKSKNGEYCKKPSKLDEICTEKGIDHRLTRPYTPKTNGMVERVNGTIKNNTILCHTYESKEQMSKDLGEFLTHYLIYRRHSGLQRELKIKTPIQAVRKWFELEPDIFVKTPEEFEANILDLKHRFKASYTKQPCET